MCSKGGKLQKRGKINLIGRLQLTTEKTKEEDNESIVALRVLRTQVGGACDGAHVHMLVKQNNTQCQHTHMLQEAIVKIMKMRKRMMNAALQTEMVEILKNMFIPPKKMIKEQIEWLIEHRYMKRDENNRNLFVYLA